MRLLLKELVSLGAGGGKVFGRVADSGDGGVLEGADFVELGLGLGQGLEVLELREGEVLGPVCRQVLWC